MEALGIGQGRDWKLSRCSISLASALAWPGCRVPCGSAVRLDLPLDRNRSWRLETQVHISFPVHPERVATEVAIVRESIPARAKGRPSEPPWRPGPPSDTLTRADDVQEHVTDPGGGKLGG
jgi:hypothetical protein